MLVNGCSDLSKSAGQFGIPAGLVFSMPVSFTDGHWSVRSDVTVTDELRVNLDACADELRMVSISSKNCHVILSEIVL